jgi:hypothetical protein
MADPVGYYVDANGRCWMISVSAVPAPAPLQIQAIPAPVQILLPPAPIAAPAVAQFQVVRAPRFQAPAPAPAIPAPAPVQMLAPPGQPQQQQQPALMRGQVSIPQVFFKDGIVVRIAEKKKTRFFT